MTLVVLKLIGAVRWPWIWILSPFWIWWILSALLFAVAFGVIPRLERRRS
jgi:hypothetical protein